MEWDTDSPPTPSRLRRDSLRSLRYDRLRLACPVRLRFRSAQATPDTLRLYIAPGCATRSPKGEGWWGRQDSNLRSHEAADLQSAPFATRDTPPFQWRAIRFPLRRRDGPWRREGRGTPSQGVAA